MYPLSGASIDVLFDQLNSELFAADIALNHLSLLLAVRSYLRIHFLELIFNNDFYRFRFWL